VALASSLLWLAACSSTPPDIRYRPAESVLEVVTLLRLHRDDDTYRFAPARDYTGKNVYRAALDRLDSLEALYSDKFSTGYLRSEIQFAKGIALERITEYELAAQHFERAAELDSELARDADEAAQICNRLLRASEVILSPDVPMSEVLSYFDAQTRELEELLSDVGVSYHSPVVREEIERSDLRRAHYADARRRLDPRLSAFALQQYQLLLHKHAESKNRNRHLIALADLYSSLSRQYAAGNPPVSLRFDPATFDEYAYSASRLYEAVSQQDGAIEKIEASRKLEAFLAFTLEVHEQKIPR
jgi:tetratricopeptide (TPR) repeat protein